MLDAAVRNFESRGYHGTSMRDIAADAGITVASIYHHFASKQQILQDIMVRVLADAISSTRAALVRAGSSPADQLAALTHAWVLFHTSRQAEALIGASEIRSLDDAGRRLVVTLRDEQERLFREVVERGVEEGSFATAHPDEATRAVLTMGSAVATWYRRGGDLAPEEMARRFAQLALAVVESAPRGG